MNRKVLIIVVLGLIGWTLDCAHNAEACRRWRRNRCQVACVPKVVTPKPAAPAQKPVEPPRVIPGPSAYVPAAGYEVTPGTENDEIPSYRPVDLAPEELPTPAPEPVADPCCGGCQCGEGCKCGPRFIYPGNGLQEWLGDVKQAFEKLEQERNELRADQASEIATIRNLSDRVAKVTAERNAEVERLQGILSSRNGRHWRDGFWFGVIMGVSFTALMLGAYACYLRSRLTSSAAVLLLLACLAPAARGQEIGVPANPPTYVQQPQRPYTPRPARVFAYGLFGLRPVDMNVPPGTRVKYRQGLIFRSIEVERSK